MDQVETTEAVRGHYDRIGGQECSRLTHDVAGRVSLEVHRRFLRRFVRPGSRVLEIGAGPGRFTLELAALDCRLVVTDLSAVQLDLNAAQLAGTAAETRVERRELLDVCDTSRYDDHEFDAVVAFGGPLSYTFEQVDDSLRGLLRIVAPDGAVVASVMSLLGTWRHSLPAVIALAQTVGEDANDAVLRTGDLRHVVSEGDGHVCQMFRHADVAAIVDRAGGLLLDSSASNWASLSDAEALATLEADPDRWGRFLDHEIAACAQPGARDGGTHILFAARPTEVGRVRGR
ncbi:MAG: methyltransferase domain-containing protein [Pseudonocardiaceae bacterium]|nr:methyltransferase domain-containing protein [Pseudonocardiaceae bacterium]